MVGAKDRFADLRARWPRATTKKPWSLTNRVSLCQATLSIGPYLLLEGDCRRGVRTRRHEA
jgi:hypothetical protein